MKKVLSHSNFLIERDLSEKADELIIADLLSDYYSLNEATALDTLKNVVSKGLLGPFSRVTVIDTIRKGNLDAQKEIIKRNYDLEDELLKLKIKLEDLKKKDAPSSQMSMVQSQSEKKKREYDSFVRMKKEQMERGMRLLDKTIGKNDRRREYYEAGFLDDKYELAKFEYDLAKKKSKKTDKVDKLAKELEAASRKVQQYTVDEPKKVKEIKDKELGDVAALKRRISTRDLETIKSLKVKTIERIDDLKTEMIEILTKIKDFLKTSPTWEQMKKSATLGIGLKDLLKKANELDSLQNVHKDKAQKVLTSESSLTDLMSKVNSAIIDGNDAKSGFTQEVMELTSKTDLTKARNLIKKLS